MDQQMSCILITGFEPFNQDVINPSWEAVKTLDGCVFGNYQVRSVQLPVVFIEAEAQLFSAIDAYQPQFVLCFGYAAHSDKILVERVAINIDDAPIPDNKGQQPIDQYIVADGASAYFSTLALRKIIDGLTNQGFAAQISNSAGTFVCNHVFYQLMRTISMRGLRIKAGFIHLPAIAEMHIQANEGKMMQRGEQIEAVKCVLQAMID